MTKHVKLKPGDAVRVVGERVEAVPRAVPRTILNFAAHTVQCWPHQT